MAAGEVVVLGRKSSGRNVMPYWRAGDVCEECVLYLLIAVLQMETLKFSISEKSCACVKKLLVSFGSFFV